MPEVSVVIPVYNQRAFLGECLDSVCAQTLRDIEVVCVDDGSTDGSGRLLDGYAAHDARVRVIHQRNAGVGPARNTGTVAARGRFVAFMDPDDQYPDDGVLADLHTAAVEQGVKVCGGSFSEFLPNGAERVRYDGGMAGLSFSEDGLLEYRDWQFDYGYVRFIYARDLLASNGIAFPSLVRYQDPPFFVRALHAAGRFYALRRVTYRCRIGAAGVDWRAGFGRRFRALCRGLRQVAEFARENGLERLYALQTERVCGDFGEVFSDWRLRRPYGWWVNALCRALGHASFNDLEAAWAARRGIDLERRRERLRRWRCDEALRGQRLEEEERKVFVGDRDNFGVAYAEGMAAIRAERRRLDRG